MSSSKFHDLGKLKDYYNILSIKTTATDEDIRKAHHTSALKYHPDKQATDEEIRKNNPVFRLIQEAYEVLKDPERRKKYDLVYMADKNGTESRRTKRPSSNKPAEPERSEFRRPNFPHRAPRPDNENPKPFGWWTPTKPGEEHNNPKQYGSLKTPQDFKEALDHIKARQRYFIAEVDQTEVAWIEARTYTEQQFNRMRRDAKESPDGKMHSPFTKNAALHLFHELSIKLYDLEKQTIKLSWRLGTIGIAWDSFMNAMNWKEMNEFIVATKQIKDGRNLLDDLDKQIEDYRKSAWEDMRKIDFVEK